MQVLTQTKRQLIESIVAEAFNTTPEVVRAGGGMHEVMIRRVCIVMLLKYGGLKPTVIARAYSISEASIKVAVRCFGELDKKDLRTMGIISEIENKIRERI